MGDRGQKLDFSGGRSGRISARAPDVAGAELARERRLTNE